MQNIEKGKITPHTLHSVSVISIHGYLVSSKPPSLPNPPNLFKANLRYSIQKYVSEYFRKVIF